MRPCGSPLPSPWAWGFGATLWHGMAVSGVEKPDFNAFAEWISFEEEDAEPAADAPMCPKPPLQRLRYLSWALPHHEPWPWGDAEPSPAVLCRSRPRSLPEPAAGYTNPAYFIFEGVPNTWVPSPGAGEVYGKQVESPAGGQQCQRSPGARVPLPSEEQRWGIQPRCVPGSPSHGHPLSPPSVGQQKRPKSAILVRDTPGLGDCSLTALHMATCLSQLDWASAEHRGDSQKTPLCQTHSTLEPPPRPCREVPRCTPDAHPGEVLLRSPWGSGAQLRDLGSSGSGGTCVWLWGRQQMQGLIPMAVLCLVEP